uniref:Protein disulfide-isomerase n=1 Tax=Trichogramma kaykai TaxID=54128 RepID=A0ABD2WL77_9HYME
MFRFACVRGASDDECDDDQLEKLRSIRDEVHWDIKREQLKLINQLIKWPVKLSNLGHVFNRGQIERLLAESSLQAGFWGGKITAKQFIELVARSGYKDKPKVDENGRPVLHRTTPLHYAAELLRERQYNVIRDLFKIYNRHDLNYVDESGYSHFHVACEAGLLDIVKKFIEFGQDLHCRVPETGDSLLHLAVFHEHKKMTKFLLSKGIDPNLTNTAGLTTLHTYFHKSRRRDDAFLKNFFKINKKANRRLRINAYDESGQTPLHYALANDCSQQVMRVMLKNGANPNLASRHGSIPLHTIIRRFGNDASLVKMLLELANNNDQPINVNAQDKSGNTALLVALNRGLERTAELLLRIGVDPNLNDNQGLTPLHITCQTTTYGPNNLAQLFFRVNNELGQRVEVNAKDCRGQTPLHVALRNNNKEATEALLRNRADPNVTNVDGSTLLHFMCQITVDEERSDEWTQLFFRLNKELGQVVRVNAQNDKGQTPLHLALLNCRRGLIELLLRKGADPNLADEKGMTPLHLICERYDNHELFCAAAEFFFDINSDIRKTVQLDARDSNGNTPIHFALSYQNNMMVELLLRRGANPNLINNDGSNTLHLICMSTGFNNDENVDLVNRFFETCKEINRSVDINAQDNQGRTPLQWAVTGLNPRTIDILLNRGADLSNFAFPDALVDFFDERFREQLDDQHFKLKLTSGALVVVERLERRGYELDLGDVSTIMSFFDENDLFARQGVMNKYWYDSREFYRKASKVMISRDLSLYDFTRLRPKQATKLLSQTDFFEFVHSKELRKFTCTHRPACLLYLGEMMSRELCRLWALYSFMQLTCNRFPILCSEIVIDKLDNEDLSVTRRLSKHVNIHKFSIDLQFPNIFLSKLSFHRKNMSAKIYWSLRHNSTRATRKLQGRHHRHLSRVVNIVGFYAKSAYCGRPAVNGRSSSDYNTDNASPSSLIVVSSARDSTSSPHHPSSSSSRYNSRCAKAVTAAAAAASPHHHIRQQQQRLWDCIRGGGEKTTTARDCFWPRDRTRRLLRLQLIARGSTDRDQHRPNDKMYKCLALLLLVATSCCYAAGEDVYEWNDGEFTEELKRHENTLVMFYAPWCGHCKKLKPEYTKAAEMLRNNDPPITLAKVDCTEGGKDTCSKYQVSGYPTLKIFNRDEMVSEYNGPREASGIAKYMRAQVGPASKELKTAEDLSNFLNSDEVSVVGFFEKDDGKLSAAYHAVTKKLREKVRFAHVIAPEVLKKEELKNNIVLYRPKVLNNKFEPSKLVYEGAESVGDIQSFIKENYYGLVGVRTSENRGEFKNPLVVAYYNVDYTKNPKGTNYWRNRVMKVAKEYPEYNFAISSKDEFQHELNDFGIDYVKGDKPVVLARDERNQKFVLSDEFSLESFELFMNDLQSGSLEPFQKSEPIPEDNSGPVKVAVAKNFDELVTNSDKDVLISFYAPWCGHCKKLAPTFEELAEKLADEDVAIVKMDATANDVPQPFNVQGFPTLYWVPKDAKDSPVKYESGRDLEEFIKFIAKRATKPLKGYDRSGKPIKPAQDEL